MPAERPAAVSREPSISTIRTARLDLVHMSISMMRALVARDAATAEREIGALIPVGFSDNLDHFLRYRLAQLDADPTILSWLARAMVLAEEDGARHVIGTIGFHGAPDEQGRLEIGYRIEAGYRRRGLTREAVRGMLDWAASERDVHRFIASVRPDNEPSLGLVRGFGFTQTRTQMDNIDGLELVLEAMWPPASGRSARGSDPAGGASVG